MTERSVVVRLAANISDYVAKMSAARAATKSVGDETESTAKRSQTGLTRLAGHARENEKAWTDTGKVMLGIGTAAAVGVGAAIVTYAQYDKQMSAVQAATLASEKEMAGLGSAAIKAGQDTAYSAREAAGGIEQLAKAGVSTADIMGGGLTGSLALAAAGELAVADAAEIAASTMVQFQLEGNEVGRVADTLAAGANKAQGSVADLGLALSYAGVPAAALGLTVEETTGTLALFANAGITGEKAGTALRAMLVSLQNPSAKAKETMSELGIEVFDAQGNFIGMEATAGVLQDRMSGLDQQTRGAALATIFGNESLGAATSLYNGGAAAVAKWTDEVSESGYAAQVASARLDSLSGDITILRGSLETALIGLGESGSGPLRDMTQDVTTLVNEFSSLPDGVQSGVLAVGGATSAVGLLGGAALIAVPWVVELYDSLGRMGPAGTRGQTAIRGVATALTGPWGLAAAGAAVAGGLLLNSWVNQRQAVDEYAGSLDQLTGAVQDSTRQIAIKALEDEGALTAAERLGISTNVLTDAVLGNADARATLREQIAGTQDAEVSYADAVAGSSGTLTRQQEDLIAVEQALSGNSKALDEAQKKTRRAAAANGEATSVADSMIGAYTNLGGAVETVGVVALGAAAGADAMATGVADVGAESETATGYVRLLGDVTGWTEAQVDAATDSIESWQESLAQTRDAFVEPLSVYKGLLEEKTAAEQASAQATADSTEDASDSWEDHVDAVEVSLAEYTERQLQRIAEQDQFEADILEITRRGRADVARELILKGEEGVALAREFAEAEGAEFNAGADAMVEATRRGTRESSALLDEGLRVQEILAREGAQKTAGAIAQELGIGVNEVERIAQEYGLVLAEGINPLLTALGEPKVSLGNRRRTGPTDTRMATGGVLPGWTPGVDVHEFASPTGGRLSLSGGEAIMRPEWVTQVGRQYVADANRAARTGGRLPEQRLAQGGIIGDDEDPLDHGTGPSIDLPTPSPAKGESPFKWYALQQRTAESRRLNVFDKAPLFDIPGAVAAWNGITDLRVGLTNDARSRVRAVQIEGQQGYFGRAWYESGVMHMNTYGDYEKRPLAERRETAIHEIGHVLGLPHSSAGNSIMRPGRRSSIQGPTSFDEENLRRLYPPLKAARARETYGGTTSAVAASVPGFNVPRPPSLSPFKAPISTAGDAAMDELYDEVRDWVASSTPAAPAGGSGGPPPGGGSSLVSIGRWLQSKGARVSGHPSFGGVTPGAHSPTSLHYRNRAIDVNYGPGGANQTENRFIRGVLPELRRMANFRQMYYREIGGRSDHDDHLHLGLAKGGIWNPHVRDRGGPLLPGYTLNATPGPEHVVAPGSRVFDAPASAATAPATPQVVEQHTWQVSADSAVLRTYGERIARQAIAEASAQRGRRMAGVGA